MYVNVDVQRKVCGTASEQSRLLLQHAITTAVAARNHDGCCSTQSRRLLQHAITTAVAARNHDGCCER
jgi:hypothetical protein